ncbi:MAG: hypothetical protein KDC43_11190 [Saprospiraceae bacterium]|nr:hypothetical protein [Saprospiraceae bacterium]MCB0677816.1 hypothetical protein [Saprospiraceae bacterium]
MKNIVGQIPRGGNFYQRDRIIHRIYRRLEAGSHIFISAPRRAGKTSIMRFLEDSPQQGYAFLYISVEDVESLEEYFETLSLELLGSKAVSSLVKVSEKAQGFLDEFAKRIKKIRLWSVEVETLQDEPPTYSEEFERLMRDMDTSGFAIVLLIDEFPVALERIAKTHGNEAAVEFLHANRTIRQRAKPGIQFVYTGSIGLPNIARQLDATATINDLNVVEVPPLTQEEGLEFTQKLLDAYQVSCAAGAIVHMLRSIDWLMPFFIQLVVQMLIDEFELHGRPITTETVDLVLEKASNHRNNIYFENYYSRLDKSLPKEEAGLAKQILSRIAEEGEVSNDSLRELSGAARILEILEFDGYIHLRAEAYRFNSPILQRWWVKYADG